MSLSGTESLGLDNLTQDLRRRKHSLIVFLILVFLVIFTIELTYPAQFWVLAVIGGPIGIFGIFKKKRSFMYAGMALLGIPLFLTRIDQVESFQNIAFFIGIFLVFYWIIVYSDEMIGRDILFENNETKKDAKWERYRKNWMYSLIKYFGLTFFITLMISVMSWSSSIDFGPYKNGIVPSVAAFGFGLLGFILIYLMLIKLPDHYESE